MINSIEEAIDFIHGLHATGTKSGLTNMRALMARLSNPQENLRMLHIAGTNGKGSTCAMLEAILRAAGYRTGLYTSPYLEVYNERIRLSGAPLSDATLTALVRETAPAVEALSKEGVFVTEFEYGTALAFLAFARAEVEVAVIEVGLGGRLDPTNVIVPMLCAVTAIGMDHMQYLGDTLEAIAREKAGIVKPGVPVVVSHMEASAQHEIERIAAITGAPATLLDGSEAVCLEERRADQTVSFSLNGWMLERAVLGLTGAHQLDNAACALACIAQLRAMGYALSDEAVREGLARVAWPGRLEWIGRALLDGAHNPQGVQVLAAYLQKHVDPARAVLLSGMLADKDVDGMCRRLASCARMVVTAPPPVPRAMHQAELAKRFINAGARDTRACEDALQALRTAQSLMGEGDVLICAGSLYLIGALRTLLREGEEHGL